MEMLRAAGLKKYYITDTYEVHALDGVSFSIEDGEFVAEFGTSEKRENDLDEYAGRLRYSYRRRRMDSGK